MKLFIALNNKNMRFINMVMSSNTLFTVFSKNQVEKIFIIRENNALVISQSWKLRFKVEIIWLEKGLEKNVGKT